MKRTRERCVHRWWLTVPYSQAGLLVQPQCHDNIEVLDWSGLTLDSWEQTGNWSHPFVLTYLKRVGILCENMEERKQQLHIFKIEKSYDCGLEIFPFPFERAHSPISRVLIASLSEDKEKKARAAINTVSVLTGSLRRAIALAMI